MAWPSGSFTSSAHLEKNHFSIKKWNASCLLSLWSIWKQSEPSSWANMLIIPLPFAKHYNDFQLHFIASRILNLCLPGEDIPYSSPLNISTLKITGIHGTSVWQAPTIHQRLFWAIWIHQWPKHKVILAHQRLPFYGIIWNLDIEPGDALAGWQWASASPLCLWPFVFSSRRCRNWKESPSPWLSPTVPLTLPVPNIKQSVWFNIFYLKLPEMSSLTTNNTLTSFLRPHSKNQSL